MSITRLTLHEIMMKYPKESIEERKNRVLDFLKETFKTNGDDIATRALIAYIRSSFFAHYFEKWRNVNRKNNRFLVKYVQWLRQEIKFPEVPSRCIQSSSAPVASTSSSGKLFYLKIFVDLIFICRRATLKGFRGMCHYHQMKKNGRNAKI